MTHKLYPTYIKHEDTDYVDYAGPGGITDGDATLQKFRKDHEKDDPPRFTPADYNAHIAGLISKSIPSSEFFPLLEEMDLVVPRKVKAGIPASGKNC